jgi:hypothetical protein
VSRVGTITGPISPGTPQALTAKNPCFQGKIASFVMFFILLI